MCQRLTRSRKRQLEENLENFGIAVDDYGFSIDDFDNKTGVVSKVNKNESEQSWDCNLVLEVKKMKRDVSPETSPTYFRKVITTVQVHQAEHPPTPPPLISEEEKIELELLEQDENVEPNTPQEPYDDENDDAASDSTDKVAEDLKVLLEQTEEPDVMSPIPFVTTVVDRTTPEKQNNETVVNIDEPTTIKTVENPVSTKIYVDYDKIDLLSSEALLESVNV